MKEEQLRKELEEAKQLIKLLKEEVGFAERGYTQKGWVKTYCGGKPNYVISDVQNVTPEVTPDVDNITPCKTHPDAPHGFDRNASHSADRYVCECEGWEPVDAVNMKQERVDETDKSIHEEKNT